MKKVILAVIFCLAFYHLKAQQFTYPVKSASKVRVFTFANGLILEGHSGKDIIVYGEGKEVANEVNGLKLISNEGLLDNTDGMGVNIQEVDGVVNIKSVGSKKSKSVKIMIPEQMALKVTSKGYMASDISLSNFKSDVEVNSEYASLNINNITGPLVLTATYGEVKVVFDKINAEKPCSLVATYSDLDVSLPVDTKANLRLLSNYGNVYTDFELEKKNTGADEELENLNQTDVESKINGGGVEIHLESPYSNVYLRKKK